MSNYRTYSLSLCDIGTHKWTRYILIKRFSQGIARELNLKVKVSKTKSLICR